MFETAQMCELYSGFSWFTVCISTHLIASQIACQIGDC